MSSVNQPPSDSAVPDGDVSIEGSNPAGNGRPCNEPIEDVPPVNGGSGLSVAVSDPISSSPQCSNSGEILPLSLTVNHNRDSSGNGVFRIGEPLLPPLNAPCSRGNNYRGQGVGHGCRYDQVRRHDGRPNCYRGVNIGCRHNQIPQMQFPRGQQPRSYRPPLISPPTGPAPFVANALTPIWSGNQGPLNYYYVPSDVYRYPANPQVQYYSGPTLARHYQNIYAAQQSYFSILLENLRAKLRKQIEYYFSMENLCSDCYLRRHMDVDGWVPISLILGFRIVEQIMKEKQSLYDSFGLYDPASLVENKQSSSNIQFIADSMRPSLTVEVQSDNLRKRDDWKRWIWPRNNTAEEQPT